MTYIITFYVPKDSCEQVKQAMFVAGAGAFGRYDQCSWQVLGQGQFRPLLGSNPTVGERGALSFIEEYRVEMLCIGQYLELVLNAMKNTHPYEEVAYHVTRHIDRVEYEDHINTH